MITKFRMEMEGDNLAIEIDGHTTYMAVGQDTERMIPHMARTNLTDAERKLFDFLTETFGGSAGVIVREHGEADSEPEVQQLSEG